MIKRNTTRPATLKSKPAMKRGAADPGGALERLNRELDVLSARAEAVDADAGDICRVVGEIALNTEERFASVTKTTGPSGTVTIEVRFKE